MYFVLTKKTNFRRKDIVSVIYSSKADRGIIEKARIGWRETKGTTIGRRLMYGRTSSHELRSIRNDLGVVMKEGVSQFSQSPLFQSTISPL